MKLALQKCEAFELKTINITYAITDPTLRLDGNLIPHNGAGVRLRYLGITIWPWYGISNPEFQEDMRSCWQRVEKLKLKPHQKIDLICTYILPHFLYKLLQANISTTALKLIDRNLTGKFKEVLHLPHTTCDGFLYTKKKEGGLGLPNLHTIIINGKLRSGLKLLNNTDKRLVVAARASNF